MRSFKNVLIATLAAALVLVAFPAAALVGSWSTPADLSTTGLNANNPQVTVSSTGLATAVWYRRDGSNDIIQSSTSQSGGAWSTPADLSAIGQNAYAPQVTVSSTGLATAVWAGSNGSHYIIQSSTSQNGGAWSTPVDLSLTGGDAGSPQVTVSSTGLATAVWARSDGSDDIIQSSTSLNGGAWSTPVDLSLTGGDAYDPQVTVSSTGLATAVWYRYDGSDDDIIQSSTSQNGGAWSTPANLSATNGDANDPQVTVSSTGLATAVWSRWNGSNDIIQSSTSLNGGAWSTPANLSATNGDAYDPQVTVSSTGLATAVWYRYDGNNDIIQSSTSLNGGAWSTPANLSATNGDAYEPRVTVSSTGLATAVWFRWDGSNDIIQSSTSQNGGAWSTPADLSATGQNANKPQVTVSSTGLATAVWRRYNGSNRIIQSSTLSNSTTSSTTPTTPTTTTPTTLAATGADLQWLAVGSLIAVVAGAGFFALGRRKRTQ
jgi:hypothetical protein